MKYEVGLNNGSCIFDDGNFDNIADAVEFARGRGGVYSVNITTYDDGEMYNVHLSYDNSSDLFTLDTGFGWVTIQNDKLIECLSQYI